MDTSAVTGKSTSVIDWCAFHRIWRCTSDTRVRCGCSADRGPAGSIASSELSPPMSIALSGLVGPEPNRGGVRPTIEGDGRVVRYRTELAVTYAYEVVGKNRRRSIARTSGVRPGGSNATATSPPP